MLDIIILLVSSMPFFSEAHDHYNTSRSSQEGNAGNLACGSL